MEKGGYYFIFSVNYKETEEHTKLGNIEKEKDTAEFKSLYVLIKSLDKYKSTFDLTSRRTNRCRYWWSYIKIVKWWTNICSIT